MGCINNFTVFAIFFLPFSLLKKYLPYHPNQCALIARFQVLFPRLFHSLRSAMKPILAINKTGVNVRKLFEQMNGEEDDEQGDMDGL